MTTAEKKFPQRLLRPGSRLRRYAAAVGSLVVAGALVVTGLVHSESAEITDAAWTDSEHAQAAITAEWPSDSWVRATANAFSNYGDYTPARDPRIFIRPRVDERPSLLGVRQWVGFWGDLYETGWNFGIRTHSQRDETRLNFCSQANESPQAIPSDTIPLCTDGSPFEPDFSQARTQGFGIAGGFAHPGNSLSDDILLVEARNVQTMAECAPDGRSRALAPSANSTWGGGSGALRADEPYGEGQGIGVIFANALPGFTAGDANYSYLQVPGPNERITRWMRPLRVSVGLPGTGRVFFRATITSRQYETYGYALSDLYVTIDQFLNSRGNPYTGSFTMVLSRSECGIETPSYSHNQLVNVFEPRQNPRPTYPANPALEPVVTTAAPLPRRDGTLAYPNDPDYPGRARPAAFAGLGMTMQGLLEDEFAATELPPMTTLTSPTEHTTAASTTTSEPPRPGNEGSEGGESVTPDSTSPGTTTMATTRTTTPPTTRTEGATSTPPAIVVPDEPADLPAAARTAEAGTVEVDGEELDVVVRGSTATTDARTASAALDTWINGGTRPPGDWKTFTADDPDDTGWRWAAINQRTGTVVYIR